jgi:hypothetical protein
MFEVGVARDSHELHITRSPQDDVVGSREVDHLEFECLGAVVACVSEIYRQTDLPEGDGLLAQDHSIEWVWVGFAQVPTQT